MRDLMKLNSHYRKYSYQNELSYWKTLIFSQEWNKLKHISLIQLVWNSDNGSKTHFKDMIIKSTVSYLESKFKVYNFFLSEKSKMKSIELLKIATFCKNGNGFRIFFIIHLKRSPKSSHFAISCIRYIYTIFTSKHLQILAITLAEGPCLYSKNNKKKKRPYFE